MDQERVRRPQSGERGRLGMNDPVFGPDVEGGRGVGGDALCQTCGGVRHGVEDENPCPGHLGVVKLPTPCWNLSHVRKFLAVLRSVDRDTGYAVLEDAEINRLLAGLRVKGGDEDDDEDEDAAAGSEELIPPERPPLWRAMTAIADLSTKRTARKNDVSNQVSPVCLMSDV